MIIWKENKGRFSSGSSGYLGKVRVFITEYDSMGNRDNPNKFKLNWNLPIMYECQGKSANSFRFKTEEEAKQLADDILAHWFNVTGTELK